MSSVEKVVSAIRNLAVYQDPDELLEKFMLMVWLMVLNTRTVCRL